LKHCRITFTAGGNQSCVFGTFPASMPFSNTHRMYNQPNHHALGAYWSDGKLSQLLALPLHLQGLHARDLSNSSYTGEKQSDLPFHAGRSPPLPRKQTYKAERMTYIVTEMEVRNGGVRALQPMGRLTGSQQDNNLRSGGGDGELNRLRAR
jgi:hypothetical protein